MNSRVGDGASGSVRKRGLTAGVALLSLLLAAGAARAETAGGVELQLAGADLSRLSLDDLAQLEITSVSRRPEPVGQAASAVYVITNDDLRRSGVLSLPEALRLAPNVEVARIDALDYSITARGFGGFEAANKLLVLIDGRSVYTPLYGGVDWDQQHVMLDDVDRIEVISGPGGALWGANAVNGVVNVTSRSAHETQGWLVGAAAGAQDSDLRVRYGGRVGDGGAFRVYANGYRRGDMLTAGGADAGDGWEGLQAGFRTDWGGGGDSFTFQGDVHDNSIDTSLGVADGYVRGGNLLGRWTRRLEGGGSVELQAYYDRVEREARLTYDALETWDVQAQHALAPIGRHEIVWGGGYRVTRDEFRTLFDPQLLDPGSRTISIAGLFVQDSIALRDDLDLTLGLKLEDNSYTELDWMPNVRLTWRPSDEQMLWAAVSRAVRNPSRIERDFAIPGIVENGTFGSEKLVAWEAGWRGRPTDIASVSVSLFYNDYDELRTNELTAPGVLPIFVGNGMEGETWGVETWADFDVAEWWRLSGGFTLLETDFRLKPGSLDISQFEAAGFDPPGWAKLRSQMRLSDAVDLDLRMRFYDDLPASTLADYVGAPAYVAVDARMAWRVTDQLELSVAGFNLTDDRHPEASEARRTEVARSVYAGLRWAY